MTTVEIVIAIVIFAIAGLLLFFAIRSFTERGFLLNNAYIYATKEERETMDKKPYYRQSAVSIQRINLHIEHVRNLMILLRI